jgi:anti-sigma B factor antagonist
MKITETTQGAVTVLKPDGPLVGADVKAFASGLSRVVSTNLGRCVVDMSAVAFIDSAGLEALLDATEELGRGGRALKLCGLNKTIRQVMELTALVSQFDHYEDANSAVRSFLQEP